MKISRIHHSFYVLGLSASFLFVSCKKQDSTPEPQQPLPEANCPVLKIDTPWENDIAYLYNEKGLLTSMDYGVSLVEEVEATIVYFEYDAEDRLKKARDEHDQVVLYEYTGDQLTKTRHYVGEMLHFTKEYNRDNQGNITEVLTYDNTDQAKLFRKYTYAYDAQHNLTQVRKYWTFNGELKLITTETYSEYDDKKNVEPWYFLPGTIRMAHNPGKISHTDAASGNTSIDRLAYQYNDKGYPVSLIYHHNDEPAWNFQYQYAACQ
jgi:hypothetical protein